MKKTVFFGALTAAGLVAGLASAGTLEDVKARGTLNCGVSTGVPGFAEPDANGKWQGFDIAVCRAVAAAVLGDNNAIEFVPTTSKTRFTSLASGEIDMLARNTTWTLSRDVDLKFDFVGVNYYDGQGFMVKASTGITSASSPEIDGVTVCIQTGTTSELNLSDHFRSIGMSYEPLPVESGSEASGEYMAGHVTCSLLTALHLQRVVQPQRFQQITLFFQRSFQKSRWARLVRHGDNEWGDVVRWTLNALITAEEFGVTAANAEELSAGTKNAEINRLLGSEGTMGEMLGLDADWAKRAIMSAGNYGEIFEANIGAGHHYRLGSWC